MRSLLGSRDRVAELRPAEQQLNDSPAKLLAPLGGFRGLSPTSGRLLHATYRSVGKLLEMPSGASGRPLPPPYEEERAMQVKTSIAVGTQAVPQIDSLG